MVSCVEGHLLTTDFTVIWDQRFVTPLTVCPPMDYTPLPPVRVPHVEQQHLNEVSCTKRSES